MKRFGSSTTNTSPDLTLPGQPVGTPLLRGLRRWDLVALVINSVVGAGIFGLPSQVFALAGPYSLAAYGAAALAIGFIVLCFAEVGSRFGATGGPYLYARVAFGPLIGFEVGWLMWIARIAGFASLTNLFVTYLAFFLPAANMAMWRALVIIGTVGVLALINIAGLRASATATNTLTAGKLIPLALLALVGVFFIDPLRFSSSGLPTYASFSSATLLVMFAFMGFEGAVIPTGEMRNPRVHLPFSLLIGMALVAVIYVALQAVCIGTLPGLAHAERPLSDAAFQILGTVGETCVAAAALVSIGGILNAILFATPRLIFAMSENGDLPRVLASTHARFRTPAAAIALTSAVACIAALFSTFVSALTLSTVVRLLGYAVTCGALPVMRRRRDVPPSAFVTPAGVLVAAIAIALSGWLLSNSPIGELRMAAAFVAFGGVLYFIWS